MFKEIETELMSIISKEAIDKITHLPSKEIAKAMELIFNINFNDIEKTYSESIDDNMVRTVVVYRNKTDKKDINQDLCMINGKIHHITLIPNDLIDVNDANAVVLCKSIIRYVSIRIALLMDLNKNISKQVFNNTLDLIFLQSIPIITCSVMKNIFDGPSLHKVIYMGLCEEINTYKKVSSETGINTILNLFDEGLGIDELLDNGFICAIPINDEKYPGIWCENKQSENKEE